MQMRMRVEKNYADIYYTSSLYGILPYSIWRLDSLEKWYIFLFSKASEKKMLKQKNVLL